MSRMPNPICHYFKVEGTPPEQLVVRGEMASLAGSMDAQLPDSAEKTAGLRKLLEAQDCFLRAMNPPPVTQQHRP